MSQYPRITLITPSYNQGQYIEETIQSVLNQNYPNLQYIIIDGGSTDNTVDIIKKYEDRIDYWVSEKDSGQSSAINKGLKIADGDIVNWLNSDDMLAEKSLFNLANAVKQNPSANIYTGQTTYLVHNEISNSHSHTVFENRACTFGFGHINQPSTYYRKQVIDKIGNLDESLNYCMDLDWWLKYLLRYDINTVVKIMDIWSIFRIHDDSKTHLSAKKFKEEKEKVYNRVFNFYFKKDSSTIGLPEETTLDLKNAKNYYHLWQSDVSGLEKDKVQSLKHWLKVNPFKIISSQRRRYFGVLKNLILKW
ncbi:MAG: glycosyltransferase [Bacteroidia bacterium]|nr:glycosyltransferase [Bacteroidia bacterium]NNC86723.1 glycosyltransferase [Bacteroidia bacterium]NNM16535.1 glycosyltransferase [Bacteroidia bacterium]